MAFAPPVYGALLQTSCRRHELEWLAAVGALTLKNDQLRLMAVAVHVVLKFT
jgi:hypothetical protein